MQPDHIEKIFTWLLAPINCKLDALPTKEDIENSLQASREELACVEEKVEQFHGEVNDLAQYIRRLDLHIFGVPTSSFKDVNVEQWVSNYFRKDLGIEILTDAIERVHRVGRVADGKHNLLYGSTPGKTGP